MQGGIKCILKIAQAIAKIVLARLAWWKTLLDTNFCIPSRVPCLKLRFSWETKGATLQRLGWFYYDGISL